MATFATSTQGIQPTGIGEQQIVQTGETSLAGVIGAVTDVAAKGIDITTSVLAKDAVQKAVKAGQVDVDATQAQKDELARLQNVPPLIRNVERETSLLEQGVKTGQLTRENARLLVANSVKKSIDENPLLANKIRAAAGSLLGFTPESEAAQQFFSAFDTEAQQRAVASRAPKLTAFEKRVNNSVSAGISREVAEEQATLSMELEDRVESLNNRATIGNLNAQNHFRGLDAVDEVQVQQGIVGRLITAANNGEDINQTLIQRELDELRSASWGAMKLGLSSGKNAPDVATMASMRNEHASKYVRTADMIKTFDKESLSLESLRDFSTAAKLYTNRAFTVVAALNEGLGPRTASSMLDILRDAEGNPARLQALLTTDKTGTLSPLIASFQQGPEAFAKTMFEGAEALGDPSVTRANMTPEQIAAIDLIASQSVVKAPPEEVESFIDKLDANNLSNKATSVILAAGRAGATPKVVKRMKDEWSNIQANTPDAIAQAMISNRDFVGNADATAFKVTDDGKRIEVVTRVMGDLIRVDQSHDAKQHVDKINLFLDAHEKGWARAFGDKSIEQYVKSTVDSVNKTISDDLKARQDFQKQARTFRGDGEGTILTLEDFKREQAEERANPVVELTPEARSRAEAAVDVLSREALQALIDKGARVRGR